MRLPGRRTCLLLPALLVATAAATAAAVWYLAGPSGPARADARVAAALAPAFPPGPGGRGWCGHGEISRDRPDALSRLHRIPDPNIRAIYVHPRDVVSRFRVVADLIADDLADVDRWWRSQDPTRAPRFDLATFPGCTGLDIASHSIELDGGTVARSGNGALDLIWEALCLDYCDLGWDYQQTLVYYDGPAPRTTPRRCGQAQLGYPNQGASWASVWIRACPPGERAAAAARGILHNLAAVPEEAPGRCPGTNVACGSPHDVMRRGDPPPLWQAELDTGRDDYYDHEGWWFDVRDSLWLRRSGSAAP